MAVDLKNRCVTDRRRFSLQASVLIILAIACSQSACQPKRQSERLTVASAGRISSLDPALASTTGALQSSVASAARASPAWVGLTRLVPSLELGRPLACFILFKWKVWETMGR